MVVHHVQDHCHSPPVTRIHELPQAAGPAVALLHREGISPVVAPIARAGKLCDRHELERRDSEIDEVAQPLHDPAKISRTREGTDVHLVNDVRRKGKPFPPMVGPGKLARDHLRWTVYPLRLQSRSRVGPLLSSVETVEIPLARPHPIHYRFVVAARVASERNQALLAPQQPNLYHGHLGRPNPEAASVAGKRDCAEARPDFHPPVVSRLRKIAANGGSVRLSEKGREWQAMGDASTPPKLPWPLPPYSKASLFAISCQ